MRHQQGREYVETRAICLGWRPLKKNLGGFRNKMSQTRSRMQVLEDLEVVIN
jgi:hypothetical protein